MDTAMFCYQCEQTALCKGCTKSGVCGKKPEVAGLQDKLIGALVGLSRALSGNSPDKTTSKLMLEGLFMTITNANFDEARIAAQLERAKELTGPTAARAPLGVLSCENEDIRSLRELLTFCIISALGGCEAQVKAHVQGNAAVGNGKQLLVDALLQMLPCIGFPRTLNALACVNSVLPEA